ncbi:MAG: aspartate kinase [Bacteroidales bacterium]|jgi:aspartate kinase|nr:aspartate kinase [Bacteroidales bacterium]
MKVYKFGGASIKNALALQNVAQIISKHNNLIVVVSAIDKTTNALERLVNSYFYNQDDKFLLFEKIKDFHFQYINEAFGGHSVEVRKLLGKYFDELNGRINIAPSKNYDLEYDGIVSFGELFSTVIFSEYLKEVGKDSVFIDIRDVITTDSNHRDAKMLWERSTEKARNVFCTGNNIYITQGFIGRDINSNCTTLGREGSDYTASALAYMLDAENVTIWKDVPGIMNADPAKFKFAEKLNVLSFREAVELAFYGAKVIHPKTIKPIENKNIPLYVKSFYDPDSEGTEIKELSYKLDLIPIYILKSNQTLLSIWSKDFSFIVEENMSKIFGLFAKYKIKVNITQNSAVSFSASIDGDSRNFDSLISELQEDYFVKYNLKTELITIRYYNPDSIEKMTKGRKILLEQRSRNTARFVMEYVGETNI